MSEPYRPSVAVRVRDHNAAEHRRLIEWLAARTAAVGHFMVTGSREYYDWRTMWAALAHLPATATMLHGHAYGADCLAQAFWRTGRGPVKSFPANWRDVGRSAGHVRNGHMVAHMPDLVLAFSHSLVDATDGTADAVRQASDRGIPVFLFRDLPTN